MYQPLDLSLDSMSIVLQEASKWLLCNTKQQEVFLIGHFWSTDLLGKKSRNYFLITDQVWVIFLDVQAEQ